MTYVAQEGAVRRRIEADFFTRASAMATDGVLPFQARGVLAVGSKPA